MTFDELVTECVCLRAQIKKIARENEDLANEVDRYRELYHAEVSRREAGERARDYLTSKKKTVVGRSFGLLGQIAHRMIIR